MYIFIFVFLLKHRLLQQTLIKNNDTSIPKSSCFCWSLALIFLFLVSNLFSQIPCGYKYSRLIKIDHTKVAGGVNLTNFPLYITTTTLVAADEALLKSAAHGGHVQSANGYDIAFTAEDGVTALDFQMENYVSTTGEYEAWVNIPTLSVTADTYIYMYYDNAAIVADQSTKATWDANTVGVWHLDNNNFNDYTVNGNNGTNSLTDPSANGAGEILTGRVFTGTTHDDEFVRLSLGAVAPSAAAGTIDLWAEMTTYFLSTYFWGESSLQNGSYANRLQIYINNSTGQLEFGMGSTHALYGTANNFLTAGNWYHIVLTWSGSIATGNGTYDAYANGVLLSTGAYTGLTALYDSADIGNDGNLGQRSEALTGSVDEVHYSNIARSGGWITTEYNNVNSPTTFYTISPEPVVWTGATNANWSNAGNWSGAIPTLGANAIIWNSAINQPTLDASEQVGFMYIMPGATLTIPAGNTLSVNFTTVNCGTISSVATGTLTFNATAGLINQYMSSTGTYNLGNLIANPFALTNNVFLNTPLVTCSGNFTISQGVFNCLTNSLSVAENVTDNSVFTAGTGTLTLDGTAGTQTIASTEATGLTTYNLVLKNTSATTPAISTTANVKVDNQLTFNAANTSLVNLNGKTLTLGTAAAAPGTLSYPAAPTIAGWLYGGTFLRWFNTAAIAIPNNTGLFPMGSNGAQNNYHPLWFGATAALTTGGTISVLHNPTVEGSVPVAFTDVTWTPPVGGTPVQGTSNAAWQVAAGNGLALSGNNGELRYGGNGFTVFILADVDACQAAGAVGTFSAATFADVPLEANRIGLSSANLTNTWLMGTSSLLASPLPIELLSFTASCENNYPVLRWTTASEINNDYFTLERTTDGVHYETVTEVKGAGNSTSEQSYSALDYGEISGITYYRLSQIDLDGVITPLQTIVYVPCENIESVNAFSSNRIINIQINADSLGSRNIILTNTLGQELLNQTKNIVPGLNIFKLYPQVNTGIYILQVIGNNKVYTKKLYLSAE